MGGKAEHNLTWFGGLGRDFVWARQKDWQGLRGRSPPDAGKPVKNFVEKSIEKGKFSTKITNKIARNFSSLTF